MTTYHAINNKPEPIALDKASAPEWAKGCDRCKYGVIAGVDYSTAPLPLYQLQPMLAASKLIRFCDCEAGKHARNYAAGTWKALGDAGWVAQYQQRVESWVEDRNTPTVHAEVA